jgi:hypothetical protein
LNLNECNMEADQKCGDLCLSLYPYGGMSDKHNELLKPCLEGCTGKWPVA